MCLRKYAALNIEQMNWLALFQIKVYQMQKVLKRYKSSSVMNVEYVVLTRQM